MTPDNDPEANEWFWIDIPTMAQVVGLDTALPLTLTPDPPFVLEAATGSERTTPVPAMVRVTIQNNHLKYALTWFGLAAVLVGVYLISQSRKSPQ